MAVKKALLVVLIGAIIIGLVIIGYLVISPNNTQNDSKVENTSLPLEEGGKDKPSENTAFNDLDIDLVDYETYHIKDLKQKFVIARLRVTSLNSTNIGLEHFKTSEGIVLNNYQEYVDVLESNSYFLGKKNVWFELVSNDKEYLVNVFVPVKNVEAKSIDLTIDFLNDKVISFDLTKNVLDGSSLKYQANDIISDGKTYQLKVSSAWDITGEQMYQGDQEYLLPSTMGVYCFNLDVVSLWKDKIVIEKAYYYPENSKEAFEALGSNISSMKHSNIIGREITEKDSGSLFFTVFNPMDNPITYKGVLKLQVSGSDNMIEIDVDLN